ncbi:MAG: hypothetical protein KME32_36105 [Mojavia pulchra JT2-VF2]|uniref:Uncharacterized protein n=1 Tax=Mojavia pulchra JT2-VF2 TaxID=287848 RepID=A0A951Q923_9NOST|nr:hypothetical protein [Mojavia pulchra JT2-VF2]
MVRHTNFAWSQALEAGETKKLHLNTLSPPVTPAQRVWPHLTILGWSSTRCGDRCPTSECKTFGKIKNCHVTAF